jgi:hypothetical protein
VRELAPAGRRAGLTRIDMTGWMIIYILAIPFFSFFLPLASFWRMVRRPLLLSKYLLIQIPSQDDFSWYAMPKTFPVIH